MSTPVDLIMPTLGQDHSSKAMESLRHIPFPFTLHLMREPGWPQAINAGFKLSTGDVLLMDDDVEILPETFVDFDPTRADITGFKLIYPSGKIQHAGVIFHDGRLCHLGRGRSDKYFSDYRYLGAATASLLYIRRHVIDALKEMVIWDGWQYEDTEFCFRALKNNFRILYHPGKAIHHESLTKKKDPRFEELMAMNQETLYKTHLTDDFRKFLGTFPRLVIENEILTGTE